MDNQTSNQNAADKRTAELQQQADGWRRVAHYFLGDFTDTATPEQAREEALRRSLLPDTEPDPVIKALERRISELEAALARRRGPPDDL